VRWGVKESTALAVCTTKAIQSSCRVDLLVVPIVVTNERCKLIAHVKVVVPRDLNRQRKQTNQWKEHRRIVRAQFHVDTEYGTDDPTTTERYDLLDRSRVQRTRCIDSHSMVAATVDNRNAMTIMREHVNQPAYERQSQAVSS
jgi:hypothetical protein